jgi:sulfate adenylyltransferase subunit 2
MSDPGSMVLHPRTLTHLERLEAESIQVMREVVAECEKPVMLYSIGKDSAVMLHLALKAFYPAKLPFPLLHVDTKWKFRDMYAFRERMLREHGFDLSPTRIRRASSRASTRSRMARRSTPT